MIPPWEFDKLAGLFIRTLLKCLKSEVFRKESCRKTDEGRWEYRLDLGMADLEKSSR